MARGVGAGSSGRIDVNDISIIRPGLSERLVLIDVGVRAITSCLLLVSGLSFVFRCSWIIESALLPTALVQSQELRLVPPEVLIAVSLSGPGS